MSHAHGQLRFPHAADGDALAVQHLGGDQRLNQRRRCAPNRHRHPAEVGTSNHTYALYIYIYRYFLPGPSFRPVVVGHPESPEEAVYRHLDWKVLVYIVVVRSCEVAHPRNGE